MYLFSGPSEYCHRETFNATCETNEVVVMQMARYGRMSLGKCIKIDLGYLGCVVDVLSVMDYKCSGRTSCSLNVDDDKLYQTKPCPTDITPHLQASYSCIKGKRFFRHQTEILFSTWGANPLIRVPSKYLHTFLRIQPMKFLLIEDGGAPEGCK